MKFGEGRLRRLSLAVGATVVLVGAFSLADAAHAEDCGNGVELRLSAPAAAQGTLLLAQIRSSKPLSEVSGRWKQVRCVAC